MTVDELWRRMAQERFRYVDARACVPIEAAEAALRAADIGWEGDGGGGAACIVEWRLAPDSGHPTVRAFAIKQKNNGTEFLVRLER